MRIAVDTSVVVAAFGAWHEAHDAARAVVEQGAMLPAHSALETYSTLTRLPDPFRAPAPVVADFLRHWFEGRWLFADRETLMALPARLAELRITGGSSYDALIGLTAQDSDAVLWTLDHRAGRTYRQLGIDHMFAS